jgi:hypothetical protein
VKNPLQAVSEQGNEYYLWLQKPFAFELEALKGLLNLH